MDWVNVSSKCTDFIKKYRYVVLVLLLGLIFLILPDGKSQKTEPPSEKPAETQPIRNLQDDLAEILSQIDGAGKVKVLLTQSAGEETVYQTDEDSSRGQDSGSTRRDTVLFSNAGREESGLIRQINPPIYQGAIVVCQGGGSPTVRLAVVQAVSNVTGLTFDCITVLKMK